MARLRSHSPLFPHPLGYMQNDYIQKWVREFANRFIFSLDYQCIFLLWDLSRELSTCCGLETLHHIHSVQVYCARICKSSNVVFIVLICIIKQKKQDGWLIKNNFNLYSIDEKTGKQEYKSQSTLYICALVQCVETPVCLHLLCPIALLKSNNLSQCRHPNFCRTDFCKMSLGYMYEYDSPLQPLPPPTVIL